MMRAFIRTWPFFLGSIVCLASSSALAQNSDVLRDVPRLQWRFDSLLRARTPQASAPIQQGIDTERAAIHKEMEQALSRVVQSVGNAPEAADLVRVLDQQRRLVAQLSERIDAAKADLSLLAKEEEYYVAFQKTGTGAPPAGLVMQTKSYPELLARKAILEEQLTALQAMQNTQQDRLSELQSQQQLRNLGTLFSMLTYLAVFLAVFWAERLVRTLLLSRIGHRRLRYAATKLFTFVVYVTLIFWFIQRVFSEFPDIITVFALVGAAFVIVMQDHIKAVFGWFGFRNAITIGQRIAIGDFVGDVIDIGILYTTLIISRTSNPDYMEYTGKIVRIPNQKILIEPLVNLHSTSDFENMEIPVCIARMDQWEEARTLLEEILRRETDGFAQRAQRQTDQRMRGFYYTHISPSWRIYLELTKEREVQFTLCFPAPIGQRRAVSSVITQEILRRFKEAGIELTPTPKS